MSSKARALQRRKDRQQARAIVAEPLGPGEGKALPPNTAPVMPATPPQAVRPGFQFSTQADTSTGVFQLSIAFPSKEGLIHFIETLLKPRARELGIEISTTEVQGSPGARAL